MMTLTDGTWRTSSYSKKNGECVEVADLDVYGEWAVRDSKDRIGPVLVIPRRQWAAFAADVRADQFGCS